MTQVGTVIDGKYEILREIGHGGMSVVYLAMDRRLNKTWAVKEIRRTVHGRNNEIIVQSLLSEANLMKKLDHPALPRIVDIIETTETIYVVMDYIPGESMDKVLDREGPQPEEKVVEWGKQLCEALGYLHSRKPPIIYRDMKPSNIICSDDRLKIIDFGIAREFKIEAQGDTVNLGTRGYAAPEQFIQNEQTDARTDVYGLGVTLYHMVTGKSPNEVNIQQYPIRYWNQSLSEGLEAIIKRCTDDDPNERFQSCAELMAALEDPERYGNTRELKRKFRRFLAAAVSCVAFLALGILFGQLSSNQTDASFQRAMEAAGKETDAAARTERYVEAIGYKPGAYEAYEGLVTAFKQDDGAFSSQEERELSVPLTTNLTTLQSSPREYAELCFEVGKLYWFYYDYGGADNQMTRMKSAIPWFSDVVSTCDENGLEYDNYDMAHIFLDIGVFNRDYSLNIQEASGKGTYAPYWERLQELHNYLAEHPNEDELVLWEGYKVIVFSLENYMSKFMSDGITKEQADGFCAQLWEDVSGLEATDEKTQEIRGYVIGRLTPGSGDVIRKIALTYN